MHVVLCTMLMIMRRYIASSFLLIRPHAILSCSRYKSNFSVPEDSMNGSHQSLSRSSEDRNAAGSTALSRGFQCSPLFCQNEFPLSSSEIEVVDLDTWQVSSGLASLSRVSTDYKSEKRPLVPEQLSTSVSEPLNEPFTAFDEIEDMRVRGSLFYKIDRGSKEFDEYKFDFHGKRSKDGWKVNKDRVSNDDKEKSDGISSSFVDKESISRTIKEKYIICASPKDTMEASCAVKKRRSPTFNQLTGPYHEPFCLDVYISKASVRACVVHRATSRVVAVAHSISKDMKFDLGSTRNADACAAVGRVLAQRALADDIHDVIFTPRKGERLEGKLQVVVQAVISGGVNVKVKVKVKQRNFKRSGSHTAAV